MAERRTIRGSWAGRYAYDPMPGYDNLPTTGFVLDVVRELPGRFGGTVRDDPAAGTPEVGAIDGFVSGDRVEFVKRMPVLYLFEPDRVRHIAEWVRERWELEVDSPVPAPPIYYEGRFVTGGSELAGRWWFDKTTVPIPSGGEQYALDLGGWSGRWTATRQA